MAFKDYSTPRPEYYVTVGGMTRTGQKNPDTFKGYYIGTSEEPDINDANKVKTMHLFKTPKGIAGVNGNAVLNKSIREQTHNLKVKEQVSSLGLQTLITFTGTKPASVKGRSPTKLFTVQFDAEDRDETVAVLAETGMDYGDEDPSDEAEVYEAESERNNASSQSDAAERKARTEALLKGGKKVG